MKKLLLYMKSIVIVCLVILLMVGCVGVVVSNDNNSSSNANSSNDISMPNVDKNNTDYHSLTYCAFGDSITAGYDRSTDSFITEHYPKLVADTLGLKSVSNYAVSGSTITNNSIGLTCIYDTVYKQRSSFDIISVMGGVNDYWRDLPLGSIDDSSSETFLGSYNLIASTLKNRFPNSFIFFITPYQCKSNGISCLEVNNNGYSLNDIANGIKNIGKKYGIAVLDLFNEGKFELLEMNNSLDGLHPSPYFFKTYTAPQIAQFIRDNYNK